jgi:Fe2+ transport system protein B
MPSRLFLESSGSILSGARRMRYRAVCQFRSKPASKRAAMDAGPAAVAFMVFISLYTPCMATVGVIRHEIGNTWMWFSVMGQTCLAWSIAVTVFRIGKVPRL